MLRLLQGSTVLLTAIHGMIGSKECWSAVATFCTNVIVLREEAERKKEQATEALVDRRR